MGELVAWGLGFGLGYVVRNKLSARWRIVLLVIAILLLGTLITLLSGELMSEPWLVIIDIAQVAAATLIGIFVLPVAFRRLQGTAQSAARGGAPP